MDIIQDLNNAGLHDKHLLLFLEADRKRFGAEKKVGEVHTVSSRHEDL